MLFWSDKKRKQYDVNYPRLFFEQVYLVMGFMT